MKFATSLIVGVLLAALSASSTMAAPKPYPQSRVIQVKGKCFMVQNQRGYPWCSCGPGRCG